MYTNKCTKCGAEFQTKNPKRVICPNCLYPDKKTSADSGQSSSDTDTQKSAPLASYSTPGESPRPYKNPNYKPRQDQNRPYNNNRRPQGNTGDRPPRQYGDRPPRPYGDRPPRQYGDRPPRQYGDRPQGGRYQSGGRSQGGRPQRPKQLLVSKEQIAQIEILYKKTLPLPNPDIHEVIGAAIDLEPRKVFFGINLVRQKMMLPKLPFPKRKLAVSQDQLFAIKNLYEPLLPVPPIGCHKIISAQLKMDEWRVHVGIGLIRKQMGLERWNPDRPDAPKEFKK